MPGLSHFQINSDIVFELLLPPILFSAAYFTSWRDFKFNLRPIIQLSFGLVIFTTVIIAVIAKHFLPNFTWPEAFLLGAIISPTDATAATSIAKKCKLPRRFTTILEGESLINDATAIVLYRFSLAAVIFGPISFSAVALKFLVVVIGGIASGLATAAIAKILIQKLNDPLAETTFTFITAFASYMIAEHLEFSGIIATVVSGIYFGLHFPEIVNSKTSLNAKANWSTLIFVINGFVFTLLGFELPTVLKQLSAYSLSNLILYSVVISLLVIIIRIVWLYPSAYIPRALFPSIAKKDPMPSWQFLLLIGLSGMRGIVSLAVVLAIPYEIKPGLPFPHLDLLIFITYCVIVVTLIIPTLLVPFLTEKFNLIEVRDAFKEEAIARVRATEEVIKSLKNHAEKSKISSDQLIQFIKQVESKLKVIQTQIEDTPYTTLIDEYMIVKKLNLFALEAERSALLKLRKTGEIHDETFHRLLDELDIEEIRTKNLRI